MKSRFVYYFDWDETCANVRSGPYAMTFKEALTVFRDPLALSRRDHIQSGASERWVTLGQTQQSALVVVVHTFQPSSPCEAQIRIISARVASEGERRQYARGGYWVQEPNMQSE